MDQRFSLPYEIANYSNKERIYFCELSSYTFKKEKNYKYFQQHFFKMIIKIYVIFQMPALFSYKHEIGNPRNSLWKI